MSFEQDLFQTLVREVRRTIQSTPPEHRVIVADARVLEALDPHERERVTVRRMVRVDLSQTDPVTWGALRLL